MMKFGVIKINKIIAAEAACIIIVVLALCLLIRSEIERHPAATPPMATEQPSPYPSTLEESDGFDTSASPLYWLNSGAEALLSSSSSWSTVKGDLAAGSKWHEEYASSNSTDTDGGIHPQNLFRIFTRGVYGDGAYSAYAKIDRIVASASPNRNSSNGVFLMIHAEDSDNLYYAGLRVDGNAVIKKKIGGTYYTIAETPLFAYAPYNRDTRPDLLPLNTWLGMKADVKTLPDNSVQIEFSIDLSGEGSWIPILSVTDAPKGNVQTLPGPGHAGIRSDFMEMSIRDFRVDSR
ncbi:MAG TPA: hypothetical protein VHF05_01570 [Candidatus Paceibacterota bacterium]|jgi:hypothetical protein|nr:hypothetical protein [Candidatus Paceibacterota bacterium]